MCIYTHISAFVYLLLLQVSSFIAMILWTLHILDYNDGVNLNKLEKCEHTEITWIPSLCQIEWLNINIFVTNVK